jgi:hypothetical protein
MNHRILAPLALLALPLLAAPADAGDLRVILRGRVAAANGVNGSYAGVMVNDPVALTFEIFLTNPPPTVIAPGDFVQYAIDTATMGMTLGSVTVAYTGGTPGFGMVDGFPVSDGIQGPNASMGGKTMNYSINHNSTLFVSVNPLDNLGTRTFVVDGSFSENWVIFGGGTLIEVQINGIADNLTIEYPETGTVFCAGDGSGTACPCGNASAVGEGVGCLHSFGMGGKLRAFGNASLASDTLVLQGSQMPNANVLYFQGTGQQAGGAGALFGDGLRCAAGTLVRLRTLTNSGGGSQYPGAGHPAISVAGNVVSPGTRNYQAWFRNSAAFCTPDGWNLTNGVSVVWN